MREEKSNPEEEKSNPSDLTFPPLFLK